MSKKVGLTIADLVKKLQTKDQGTVVDFLIYEPDTDNIVCASLNGPRTTALMKLFAK